MSGTNDVADLREEFMVARGVWSADWERILRMSPGYFAVYTRLSGVPWTAGSLEPKVRELMGVAVNSAVTHLQAEALRGNVARALRQGATSDEILEVLQLTSVLGIHTMTVGVPALLEVMTDCGMSTDLAPLNADQERLKADFITNRGYWTDLWQTVLTLSPEYFAAYADYSSLPWKEGPLPAKVKEFVYIAITASTTHLFEPGIKVHIKNAFEHGATAGEILEVFQLVSDLGIQTVTVGTAVLEEEVARLRQA